ncbi:MAG: hypothetical protein ACR2NO_03005 [Chloroflexota bacterium]
MSSSTGTRMHRVARMPRLIRQAVLRAGLGGAAALAMGTRTAWAQAAAPIRWDIVNLNPVTGGLEVSPGGESSASADDSPPAQPPAAGERITYTGNGVFVPGAPRSVSGGGGYVIRNKQGGEIGRGTYRVTELIYWTQGPGTPPPQIVSNRIPDAGTPSAGLAVLRIAYSDGQQGILAVSCQLVDTPNSIFEGVFGTHGAASFWSADAPQTEPFVNANRTLFTILRGASPPAPAPPLAPQRAGRMTQWHIVSLDPQPTVPILSPGGVAHARAFSAERITYTGTGTFTPGTRGATGGGTYVIEGPQGQALSRGTYRATELISWEDTPGTFASLDFRTGTRESARTGLVTLRIAHSDGAQGILVVSCRQADSPGPVFEGVLGTHGFESYYAHEFALGMPFVNANRTIFHVLGIGLPATGDAGANGVDVSGEPEVEADD